MSSTLNFDLNGLSKGGELVGLCSEPHQEVSEDSVLKDVISSFLETTSVSIQLDLNFVCSVVACGRKQCGTC